MSKHQRGASARLPAIDTALQSFNKHPTMNHAAHDYLLRQSLVRRQKVNQQAQWVWFVIGLTFGVLLGRMLNAWIPW